MLFLLLPLTHPSPNATIPPASECPFLSSRISQSLQPVKIGG
ncbi:MAG: hypothetical protein FJ039_05360 [Chloroflexi bacterium]|nr:hypothetical protein [Chloroflexota bacterium]